MSQNLIPARVSSPGKILSRELEARGWTQQDLAAIMERPAQAINEIIQGKKQITPETALELAGALDTTPEFWMNLETNYRLHLAQQEKKVKDIERKRRIYELAPISEMTKLKWLSPASSVNDLERQVCHFYEISSLDESPRFPVSLRCSEQRDPQVMAQLAWVKRVETLSKQQSLPAFDPICLKQAIPQILTHTKKPEEIAKVPDLIRSLGIHFVVVPHLPKTYLDGATFRINDRPVIALTLRYDRIDSFWFTLMHELGHIFAGHQGASLDDNEHPGVSAEENEANQLARDWLIPPNALEGFLRSTRTPPSKAEIEHFAQAQHRHPGIIVGRLQRIGELEYKNLRASLVKVKHYFPSWVHG